MKREAKKEFVENIKNIVNESSLILVFHYRGLSMSEMSELRVQSFNSGSNIRESINDRFTDHRRLSRLSYPWIHARCQSLQSPNPRQYKITHRYSVFA